MEDVLEIRNIIDQLDELKDELNEAVLSQEPHRIFCQMDHRVIHLVKNPFATEIDQEDLEHDNLLRENERLKARLTLVEAGNTDVTMRIDEAVDRANRIEMLQQKIEEYKSRMDKIRPSLKKTAMKFREACLHLFGYRVDALDDNIYRLSHKDAEGQNERLFFKVKPDGTVSLLSNDYSNQYDRFLRSYVEESDSFPAFLAAITLDLFKSQTQSMSVDMSTTILPAENTIRKSSS